MSAENPRRIAAHYVANLRGFFHLHARHFDAGDPDISPLSPMESEYVRADIGAAREAGRG